MSSVFKIYSPEDCDFYYDGELQGHIDGNSKKAFRFEVERKGVYRLEFINSEYQTELMIKVSIDADEEREVELDFSEVNEPVIQERERERIIIAIEHDYKIFEHLPEEIISAISKNGIVTIPKGVRKIGTGAFWRCGSLRSVNIPDSVTVIGEGAFAYCSSLTSVTIGNSVTKIEKRAFIGCSNLTSVTIPDSVTEIGEVAFAKCNSLQEFNGKFASEDGRCLIIESVFNSFAPAGLTKYTIPDSVTSIGKQAFYNSSITSITIPDSVNEIRAGAFSCCHSLKSITIPNSVTEIGRLAFFCCFSLTSITIPDNVTKIGDNTFIGCDSLTSVYCKATTPPKALLGRFGWKAFVNNAPDLKIYVPKSEGSTVLEAYKSAEGWKDYADIIEEYDFDNE